MSNTKEETGVYKETKKRKDQKILGYCALCGKKIRVGTSFDLVNVGSRMKAVCKGGCENGDTS